MNQMTLGQRIASLRRQKDLTQEAVAEALGVSPQAVSKWENDASCPDIMLLPQLAKMLGVTVDVLLSGEQEPETRLVPAAERKNFNDLIFRVRVDSKDGSRMRVNLPLALVKLGMAADGHFNVINIQGMNDIHFEQIVELAESGVLGKLVEVDDGEDHMEVWVE